MEDMLFDIPGLQKEPEKPKGRRWGGNDSAKARAIVAPTLPRPCTRCGETVTADMKWHADHILEDVFGGTSTPDNLGPAHKHCNESAGGKIGAAMTNGFKQAQDQRREVTVKWW